MNRRRVPLLSNGLKIMKMLAASVLWIVSAPSVFALEISWPLTQATMAETPEGFQVEAIESEPPGHPLFLGRAAPQAGVKVHQPSLRDGGLVFGPNTTAFAADFWKNFKDFGFEVELKFDTVEVDQTVLVVSGCWELRLAANAGSPELQLIGYRPSPLKAVAVSLEGIQAGQTYNFKGRMQADGTLTLESSDGESYTAQLGQPPSDWASVPEFYVGSANPRALLRPFQGTISRLLFRAEEIP